MYSLWLCSSFKECACSVRFGRVGLIKCPQCIRIGDNTAFGEGLYLTAWEKYNLPSNMIDYNADICVKQVKGKRVQSLSPLLSIGKDCHFGAYNHISCTNQITIGNGVLTGKWVTITDNSHGNTDFLNLELTPLSRPLFSKGPIVIKDNVWIGDKATILPNITIGDGAIIAANSVVTHDVPSYCVVAGNPAKIVRNNLNISACDERD